jgi:hypothetical protein
MRCIEGSKFAMKREEVMRIIVCSNVFFLKFKMCGIVL